jgi:hypothetical protein
MDNVVVSVLIDVLTSLIVVARSMGVNARREGYNWKDCPFDFSAQAFRNAWLTGYSDQEDSEAKEAQKLRNVHGFGSNNEELS